MVGPLSYSLGFIGLCITSATRQANSSKALKT